MYDEGVSLFALALVLAAPTPRHVAVLELANPAELSAQEVRYFTDVVRGVAAELPQASFFVMTRENILATLPPGTDLADCMAEASCEVELGEKLGADYLVFGEALRVGQQLKVSLKLYDIRAGGRFLGQEAASAGSVDALEPSLRNAAVKLFDRLDTAPERTGGNVPVVIESEPRGAKLFVDGVEVGVTPWSDFVTAGSARLRLEHPDHAPAETRVNFEMPRDGGTQKLRVVLEPRYGRLNVVSRVPGAEVHLDGEPVGRTPWQSGPLTPRRYRVTVRQPRHAPVEQTVRVVAGKIYTARLSPQPHTGTLRVLAEDPDGGALEVDVRIDGVMRGRTPLSLTVAAGRHEVALRDRAGRMASSREVVWVRAGETQRLQVEMEPARTRGPDPFPGVGASKSAEGHAVALSFTTGTGGAFHEGEGYRSLTNLELSLAGGSALGPLRLELAANLAVEEPVTVVLRPGARVYLWWMYGRLGAQYMVHPSKTLGAFSALGLEIPLGSGWALAAEGGAGVWPAGDVLTLDGRLGVRVEL